MIQLESRLKLIKVRVPQTRTGSTPGKVFRSAYWTVYERSWSPDQSDIHPTSVTIYNIAALIEVYHHEFISKKVQIKIKSLLAKRSYWEQQLKKEKSDLYKVVSVMQKDITQARV